MGGGTWLAGVAALALMVGAPGAADAAPRTKAVASKAKPKRKPIIRHRAPARVTTNFTPPPVSASPAANFRWLDDGEAMIGEVGDRAPDLAFNDDGVARYAWRVGDALVVAEPIAAGEMRYYFYDADVTVPFLVRDQLGAFGFDRGELDAVYDQGGQPVSWTPGDWRERMATDLRARGRQLYFAAHQPQRAPERRQASNPWTLGLFTTLADAFGGDGGRARREGDGHRWHDGRSSRDRDERASRERPSAANRWTRPPSGGDRSAEPGRRSRRQTDDAALALIAPAPDASSDRPSRRRAAGDATAPPVNAGADVTAMPIALTAPVEPMPAAADQPQRRGRPERARSMQEPIPPIEVAVAPPLPSQAIAEAPPAAERQQAAEPPAPEPKPAPVAAPPEPASPPPEERKQTAEPDTPRPDHPD